VDVECKGGEKTESKTEVDVVPQMEEKMTDEKLAVDKKKPDEKCEPGTKSEETVKGENSVENGNEDKVDARVCEEVGLLPVDTSKKHIKENVLQEIAVNKEINVPVDNEKTKPEKFVSEEKEKRDCDKDENNAVPSKSETEASEMEVESNGTPNVINTTSIPVVGIVEPMDCD
jgi:hypothetical protein